VVHLSGKERHMSTSLRSNESLSPDDARRLRITGVLWLVTFATSIPAALIYHPILQHHGSGYLLSAGHDKQIALGAFLELLLIIANLGTAVVPYSIYKRYNDRLALGFVASRIMECMFIAIGVLSLLAAVKLRQQIGGPGSHVASLDTFGRTLVDVKNWTFLLGPGFVVGIGNGLFMGYLMYRSGLMPQRLAWLGLVGGPLVLISGTLVLLDVIPQNSSAQAIATIPEFFWELSIGLYLTLKYKPATIVSDQALPAPA
jgi:hypothetical protein